MEPIEVHQGRRPLVRVSGFCLGLAAADVTAGCLGSAGSAPHGGSGGQSSSSSGSGGRGRGGSGAPGTSSNPGGSGGSGALAACPSTGVTRTPLRRLTRFEYTNTVRDLLGVDPSAAKELPADEVTNGFDNN